MEITLEAVGVAVAILGLFGGGYSGVRAGAISRMRLEDRRSLLDNEIPALREALRRRPDPNAHADDERLRGYLDAPYPIRRRVALLPWADRSLWKRADKLYPDLRVRRAMLDRRVIKGTNWDEDTVAEAERAWPEHVRYLTEWAEAPPKFGDIREAATFNRPDAVPIWAERDEFDGRLRDFETHLHRKLRPGLLRRIASGRTWIGLVARGPRRV